MTVRASQRVVGDVLRERARDLSDKLFWWAGDDQATYADADARSDRVAAGIAQLGVGKGDRVVVVSTNRWEYLEVIFGLAKVGAIQVPINAYLRGDFLQYQIDQSGAEVAIADGAGVEALIGVVERAPALKKIVAFDDISNGGRDVEIVPFHEVRTSTARVPAPELAASDLVSIMYTSGTTGLPKGCMLPHGYYMNCAAHVRNAVPFGEDETVFTTLPMFHGHGQILVLMTALHEGQSVVIEPEFHVSSILDRWIETGATVFQAVGMMSVALLELPPSEKDRAHRVHTGFSVPLPPRQQQQFLDRFGIDMSTHMFGQTECAPVTMSLPGDAPLASQGRPAPYYDVAVVDDDDTILPRGEVGEIVVRPKEPNVMYAGYWRQQEATVHAWRNLWHHTRNSGRFDATGALYLADRTNNSLRRRGENIASMEVEAAIVKHPKVSQAAVVAVPSELVEDDVLAYLVPSSGETVEPEELFEFFKESLPYFAIPRYVSVVDEIPKNASVSRQERHVNSKGVPEGAWDFEALGLRVARTDRR